MKQRKINLLLKIWYIITMIIIGIFIFESEFEKVLLAVQILIALTIIIIFIHEMPDIKK